MKKLITIVSIMAVIFGIYALYTVSNAADETWTDFSNAKYEIEYGKSGGSDNIKITGITRNTDSLFYWFITATNNKPEFNEANRSDYNVFSYGEDISITGVSDYLELNQDLYLWIVERKSENSYKFVVEGKKLERTGYSKDYNLFIASFIVNTGDQIVFNDIAWGKHTRNMKLKIGKITDTTILNNIKNNANDGFSELLKYSKTATAIYDNQLVSSKRTVSYGEDYFKGYETDTYDGIPIQIPISSLEDGAYYFVYATLDDENGKYYPVEGVTITQAKTFPENEGQPWYLSLYGTNDFKWSEFGSGVTDGGNTGTTTPKTDPDETVATTILPKTGINLTVVLAILGMSVVAIVSYNKYKTWKEIK